MNQTQKDILSLTLWIVSLVITLVTIFAIYTYFGVNTPYHDVYPGMSSQDVELSRGGEIAEMIGHVIMYTLDLGVPFFAVLVTHHLFMSLKSIISGGE
ncbi:MAG: hypothetical protein JXA98_01355 [Methanosarcinaceae archaeon]|jgi:hypothetical protein|nr:hypothetical protein [Methanosarcinaceae archaeon]